MQIIKNPQTVQSPSLPLLAPLDLCDHVSKCKLSLPSSTSLFYNHACISDKTSCSYLYLESIRGRTVVLSGFYFLSPAYKTDCPILRCVWRSIPSISLQRFLYNPAASLSWVLILQGHLIVQRVLQFKHYPNPVPNTLGQCYTPPGEPRTLPGHSDDRGISLSPCLALSFLDITLPPSLSLSTQFILQTLRRFFTQHRKTCRKLTNKIRNKSKSQYTCNKTPTVECCMPKYDLTFSMY